MNRLIWNALTVSPLVWALAGCASDGAGPVRTRSYTSGSSASGTYRTASANPVSAQNRDARAEEEAILVRERAGDSRYDITREQIGEHVKNGSAVIIDARSPEQFAKGHVRGAVNLPAGQIDDYIGNVLDSVGTDQLVVIYCGGQWCDSGDMVYERLAQHGFTNMKVYKPGWMLLASAGYAQ